MPGPRLYTLDLERIRLRLMGETRDPHTDLAYAKGWLLARGFVEQEDGRFRGENTAAGEFEPGEVLAVEPAG